MRFLGISLIVVVAGLFVGCGSDNRTGTPDGSIVIDLGPGADAGETTDSGMAGTDMGNTGTDMGTSGGDGGSSANTCGAPAATPPTLGVQCTMATYTCIAGCGTSASCQQTCVMNDDFDNDGTPDTNCGTCTNAWSLNCAFNNGCEDEYYTAGCCIAAACAGTPTAECAQSHCIEEQNAMITCANTALGARPACANDPINCFPAAG